MIVPGVTPIIRAISCAAGRGERAPVHRAIQIWKSFKIMTPSGVIGDARKANAEKGEKLLDIAAELLAERLVKGEPWA